MAAWSEGMQTALAQKAAKVTKVLNFEDRSLGELARDHGSLERGNADGTLARKAAKITKVPNFGDRSLGESAWEHDSSGDGLETGRK
jgi:hypothetical protein